MNWRTVLVYGALALGALLALRVVVSFVLGILGLVWTILTTVVTLLAVGALLYGGYKLFSLIRDTEPSPASGSAEGPTDPGNRVETLKERYASGELSEDEFERRLDRELDGMSGLDRGLRRERE